MPSVTVVRTYLEMTDPAELRPPRGAGASPLAVAREYPCTVRTYQALYRGVGESYHWRDRLVWSDARLAGHLARPEVEVWVGRIGDEVIGFFELERHADRSTEIVYFGLLPRFVGQGHGAPFLAAAVREAWGRGAGRVWLHTCTLDAPAALPNYLARGFRETRRESYEAVLPDR
jgi:GNAT superfamily N-acetyltransferase